MRGQCQACGSQGREEGFVLDDPQFWVEYQPLPTAPLHLHHVFCGQKLQGHCPREPLHSSRISISSPFFFLQLGK